MLESLELSRRLTPVTQKSDKTRVTVEIRNRSYTIVGDEEASHVRLVASLVDQKMREIHELNPSLDTAALAVLTAINSMNDYLTLKDDYATLLGSIKKKRGLMAHDRFDTYIITDFWIPSGTQKGIDTSGCTFNWIHSRIYCCCVIL